MFVGISERVTLPKFRAKFNRNLNIPCFKIDCESAVIRAINTVYPNANVKLCLVHIARNWLKKLFECVTKSAFNRSTELKDCWRMLLGIFYLPPWCIEHIRYCLNNVILPSLVVKVQPGFRKYIAYLEKWYLADNAIYHHTKWNYYYTVSNFSEFNTSKNCAEVTNRKLKVLCGNGKISFHEACRILKDFKTTYVSGFQHHVKKDNLNPRSKKALNRESNLLEIMTEWDSLIDSQQAELSVQYAFKFGHADRWAEFTPEFPEDLPNWADEPNLPDEPNLETTISLSNFPVEEQMALTRLDPNWEFEPDIHLVNNPEPISGLNPELNQDDDNEYSIL